MTERIEVPDRGSRESLNESTPSLELSIPSVWFKPDIGVIEADGNVISVDHPHDASWDGRPIEDLVDQDECNAAQHCECLCCEKWNALDHEN